MTETVSPAPASETPTSTRRLKLALIASLALNVLVIGAVLGAGIAWKRHGAHGPRGGEDFGLMGFSRSLPHDRRAAFRKELRAARETLKPLVREIDEARADVAAKLATEPFDREALKTAIDQVTSREVKLKEAARNVFLDKAGTLSPDERRQLSDWWKSRRRGRGRDAPEEKPGDSAAKP